jgi:protein-tyrosine phosphatase
VRVEHKVRSPERRGRADRVRAVFVDVHSHVVPSGDDGVQTADEGLSLCRQASERGTRILFATPHVWPHLTLPLEREEDVRRAHAAIAPEAGLELRLGWELTPTPSLLEQDPSRYVLEGTRAVLMEVPFHGSLGLSEKLAEHIEAASLTPVIAHPERSDEVGEAPSLLEAWRERGWLLQLNATSLLGYHGPDAEATAWTLVGRGLADLVSSDGHRAARPPFLDEAYERVRARVGEGARALFDGRALGISESATRDRVDLAQRR